MRSRRRPAGLLGQRIVRGFQAPAPSTVASSHGDRPFVCFSHFWSSSHGKFLGFQASQKTNKQTKLPTVFALPNPFAVSPNGGAGAGKPKAAPKAARLSRSKDGRAGAPAASAPRPAVSGGAGQPWPGGRAKGSIVYSSSLKASRECPQEETQVCGGGVRLATSISAATQGRNWEQPQERKAGCSGLWSRSRGAGDPGADPR